MNVSSTDVGQRAPRWFRMLDRAIRQSVMAFACTLLVLMVLFTAYTVVMRYVFKDPPFWGDTVSLFCNIGLVFIAYALAVRDREDIASEALHTLLPPLGVRVLEYGWLAVTVAFGLFLAWFGFEAAWTVPGLYWELGGLPKMVPMLALPLSGVLTATAGIFAILEQANGWGGVPPIAEAPPITAAQAAEVLGTDVATTAAPSSRP